MPGLNTAATRDEVAAIMKECFGGTIGAVAEQLDTLPFVVAIDPATGRIAAVCVFEIRDDGDEHGKWGEIKWLAAHPDLQCSGHGKAVLATALRYFKEHAPDSKTFGLYADTHHVKVKSPRYEDNMPATMYYEKQIGMHTSDSLGEDSTKTVGGVVTEQWMEGDVDACLEKIGVTGGSRCQVVDAGAYSAVRYVSSSDSQPHGKFELYYTYRKHGWSDFFIKDIPGLIGGEINLEQAESDLRAAGISVANIKDAMATPGKKITLCAGARTKQRARLFLSPALIQYRQADERGTDDRCLKLAAANGLASKGRGDIAKKITEKLDGRAKMSNLSGLLGPLGIQVTPFKQQDSEKALQEVHTMAKRGEDACLLVELVDGNGLAGHAVFLDLGRKVILDPAETHEIPFTTENLDRCTGPYSICIGLKHVHELILKPPTTKKTQKKKRKRGGTSGAAAKKPAAEPPPQYVDAAAKNTMPE
jgi:GNAT superfamily N-acetyltransferase